MLFVSFIILLVCAFMVAFLSHADGHLSDSFISFLDSEDPHSPPDEKHSYDIIFAIVCSISSAFLQRLAPSVSFLPYLPLLVFSFVLYRSHRNAESVLSCQTDDGFKVYAYVSLMLMLYQFAQPHRNADAYFHFVLAYVLLYSFALLSRHNLMQNLFHHYRRRSIKLESQVEKLKADLEYYQARCRRLEKSDD